MNRVKEIAEKVAREAKRSGKISIFSIANTANKNNAPLLFPAIRETDATIAGNVLVTSEEQIKQIIETVDGLVDVILMDAEAKTPGFKKAEKIFRERVKKSRLLTFKPNDLTVEALDALIAQRASPLGGKKAAVIGAGNIGSKIGLKLLERGVRVILTRRNLEKLQAIVAGLNAIKPEHLQMKVEGTTDNLEACRDADILVGATAGTAAVTEEMISAMHPSSLVVDAGNGTLFPEAIRAARERNISILCLFIKPGYDGTIQTVFETEKLIGNMERRSLGDFYMLSGGVLGERGDVIVDDVRQPKRILAIADGRGDVIPDIRDPLFRKHVEKVQAVIRERSP